jgi:hypothetical protein
MTEQELLADCLKRLNAAEIPYMLVGSMASNYWGIPRSTHDIDFVVEYESKDGSRLVNAFQDQFFIQDISVRSALRPPYQFNALDNRYNHALGSPTDRFGWNPSGLGCADRPRLFDTLGRSDRRF